MTAAVNLFKVMKIASHIYNHYPLSLKYDVQSHNKYVMNMLKGVRFPALYSHSYIYAHILFQM